MVVVYKVDKNEQKLFDLHVTQVCQIFGKLIYVFLQVRSDLMPLIPLKTKFSSYDKY